ncbi:hypothetical protein [Nocardia tengchongensis]|uniref:hypothetical protein n=1 Tax=Nocardia tengchongensis TaxID=2055889 RepID=UPI0036572F24
MGVLMLGVVVLVLTVDMGMGKGAMTVGVGPDVGVFVGHIPDPFRTGEFYGKRIHTTGPR